MSISERLQMVIKMNGMTNASFADKIGVQRSSISHVLAGRNKPSIDFIQKILSTFPKVDADWLVTGKKVGRTIADTQGTHRPIANQEEQKSMSFVESIAKDEDPEPYEAQGGVKTASVGSENKSTDISHRKISRVIVFYNDGTFEEVLSID